MSNEVDKKIGELSYDPQKVLTFKGDKIENFKPNEGGFEGGKYIVITREKVSIQDTNCDIGIIATIVNLTCPGALLQANAKLVENMPAPISVGRKPMSFVIDLPGMGEQRCFTVENPSYGSLTTAIQNKFDFWSSKLSQSHSIVARTSYTESMVYSEAQLLAKFGFGIKQADKSLSIDFQAINNSKSSVFIASFRQIFYTVAIDRLPERPSNVIADDVTWADFQRFGVNNENPPAIVTNVCYGRTIFIKMESSSTDTEVEGAFKAAINNVNISGNTKYQNILKNTSYTAVILGGGIQAQNEVINITDYTKIREVITKYSQCNKDNPGYPISYSTNFLKDNQMASVNSTTEYVKTTTTEYSNAEIELKHSGGYVAQFKVEWDEITFDQNGHKQVTRRGWEKNLCDLTAPFSTVITLQGNSGNLCVFAKECTGLAWEWWRTVFDKKNVPLVPKRTFSIYGTTLNQAYEITPEC